MISEDAKNIAKAKDLIKTHPKDAEAKFQEIISQPPVVTSDSAVREYETALISLGQLYRDQEYIKENRTKIMRNSF